MCPAARYCRESQVFMSSWVAMSFACQGGWKESTGLILFPRLPGLNVLFVFPGEGLSCVS